MTTMATLTMEDRDEPVLTQRLSMGRCLTMEDRDELRALQDRFLAVPCIANYVKENGEDARMFQYARPTAHDLKTQLWPDYREGFENTIRDHERENSAPVVPPAPPWKRAKAFSLHKAQPWLPEDRHEVSGTVSGNLAIIPSMSAKGYAVAHQPSGRVIFFKERHSDCKAIVAELRNRFPGFDTLIGKLVSDETLTPGEESQAKEFRGMRSWIWAWKPSA
jgi:hypothetical protein